LVVLVATICCTCHAQTKMVAYYPTWLVQGQSYLPMTKVPTYYTHINVAFGCFAGGDVVFQTVPSNLNDMLAQKKLVQARGQKVILTMGGWTCNWKDVFANTESYAQKTVAFALRYGFDGIDVDFEYMGEANSPVPASIQMLVTYMKTIRSQLPRDLPLILTPMPSYVDPAVDSLNDYSNGFIWVMNNISQDLSWIQIMCYNNANDQDPYTNIVNWSQKFTIKNWRYGSVTYNGYDSSKIVVGILSSQNAGSNGYLTPPQINASIQKIRGRFPSFAGTMMWDVILDYYNPSGQFFTGNGIQSCVHNNQC